MIIKGALGNKGTEISLQLVSTKLNHTIVSIRDRDGGIGFFHYQQRELGDIFKLDDTFKFLFTDY